MCIATSLAASSSVVPSTTVNTPIRPPMCKYAPNASLSVFVLIEKRRILNFSPIVEIASFILSSTVLPLDNLDSIKASTVSTLLSKIWLAISLTNSWKPSLRATKSVSELISTIAASLSFTSTCTSPSAAIRSAFLAAFAIPFSRK